MATSRGVSAFAAPFLALGILGASSALAATDEQRGADLLTAVERGERECDGLDRADFEAVGEFVMGRMRGSPGAHEGMDRMMASMMGEGGLDRMHEVMGIRFSGCGNPWIVMGLGMIIFWALVILGVVWLVRELTHSREPRGREPEPDAIAILDRWLAAGEISPDEYRERRVVLRGESSPSSGEG